MTEITLSDLIEQVKTDLFSPYLGTPKQGKIVYPLFFVDGVELELKVDIQHDLKGGIKITIPQIAEGSLESSIGTIQGHSIKIHLTTILTPQEMRDLIKSDPHQMEGIRQATSLALKKTGNLAGPEE